MTVRMNRSEDEVYVDVTGNTMRKILQVNDENQRMSCTDDDAQQR